MLEYRRDIVDRQGGCNSCQRTNREGSRGQIMKDLNRYDKRSCMMQSRLIPPVKSLPMDGVMIESE